MGIDQTNKNSSRTYYDEHFTELHNNTAEELRWSQIRNAIFRIYPVLPKDLSILDCGCSSGWLSNKLTEFGKVTGIDFSEKAVAVAKIQFPNVDFRTMDITSKDAERLGKESFDLIVSSEVMEHIIHHTLFIEQLSFLLKNDGILLLTTPNGYWYNSYFSNEMLQYKQPIENWVTGKKLKSLLQPGFTSINLKTFYANWIYSSRRSTLLKISANDYIRAGLKKMHLFQSYSKMLESFGLGLYLLVTAKKK